MNRIALLSVALLTAGCNRAEKAVCPAPVHVVEMPSDRQLASPVGKPADDGDDVTIAFAKAPGWIVTYTGWGGGLFGRPGFHAILTPPEKLNGYGEVRCAALDRNGVAIGADFENWLETSGPIEVIPHFDLIGKVARVTCHVMANPR